MTMNRPRLFIAACLFLPRLLLAQPAGLAIAVDDHRPLSVLADELEKRYQIVVTYEEGPWAAAGDVEDVTAAVAKANGPNRAAPSVRVIVPRKAAVSFEYAHDPVQDGPAGYADLLTALLRQYDASGAPGEFRFEGDNGIYHLIPKDQMADAAPVFSTPVRLADEERTVDDTLDEIVAQLNASSPVKIGWGLVPLNLFNQTRVRIAADGVPAREVLHQILEQLPRRVTWRLNYDPTTTRYYLSFLIRGEK